MKAARRYHRGLVFESISIKMESYYAYVFVTLKDRYFSGPSIEMTLTFDSTRGRKVAEDSCKVMDSRVTLMCEYGRRCWA